MGIATVPVSVWWVVLLPMPSTRGVVPTPEACLPILLPDHAARLVAAPDAAVVRREPIRVVLQISCGQKRRLGHSGGIVVYAWVGSRTAFGASDILESALSRPWCIITTTRPIVEPPRISKWDHLH